MSAKSCVRSFSGSRTGLTAMTAAMIPPFESPLTALYDTTANAQTHKRLLFRMPRVVPDQKAKFEADELFRRLARESEVRYTGYRDRPPEERRQRFQAGIREGQAEIAFLTNGTNINLSFSPSGNTFTSRHKDVDFEKESGKVHLRSPFILNGVCVRWKGYLDLERLDGVGCLEYDEESALEENRNLQEEIEKYKQRLREFEEKQQRAFRLPPTSGHGGHSHGQPHTHPHHLATAHVHPHPPHTPEQTNIQVR